MILTYKYRLKVTDAQSIRINQWIGTCRFIYNMCLSLKKDAYEKSIPLSFFDLQKQLPTIKDIDWIRDVPAECLQGVVQKLERSYQKFFKKLSGFPRYSSKKQSNSILFKSIKYTSKNTFVLPKIGALKVFNDRPPKGILKTAVINSDNGKFYLCVNCEVETTASRPCENQTGIDVGISNFAVLSDGTIVSHPAILRNNLRKLRIAQRSLSRAIPKSKGYMKKKLAVQKLNRMIKMQRQDFLHKLSTQIVMANDIVAVEKLNIHGMVRSNLSKQISDSGWGYFSDMIKYKCSLFQKSFVEVSPHYTSQECFECGHISSDNRKTQSDFKCVECGHSNHADINGAKNILRRGQCLLAQSTDNSLRLAKNLTHEDANGSQNESLKG